MRPVGVLSVAPDAVAAGLSEGKEVEWIERRSCESDERLIELVDILLARKELRGTKGIRVLLDPSLVQLRTLHDLPPVPDRQLPDLVRAQSRKFFRLNGSPVVIDAVWTEPEPGKRVVRAVAASLALLRALDEAVDRTGLRMLGVYLGSDGPEGVLRLETPQGRNRRLRQSAMGALPFALAVLLAWGAAGALYLGDLARDRLSLESEMSQLQESLKQVRRIRDEITSFEPTASAVRGQWPDAAWASDRILGIARALPDSAHLLHLTLRRNDRTRLDARATDPVAVVSSLTEAGVGPPTMERPPVEEVTDERHWYRLTLTWSED